MDSPDFARGRGRFHAESDIIGPVSAFCTWGVLVGVGGEGTGGFPDNLLRPSTGGAFGVVVTRVCTHRG
jgi:hypothetical protein